MVSYEVVVYESVSWKASRGGVSIGVHTIVCVRHKLFHMRSAGVMCVGGSSVGMWFMAVWSCLLVCGLVLSCAVSSGEKGLSWGGS